MPNSNWRATCFVLPRSPATVMAWNGFSITQFSARSTPSGNGDFFYYSNYHPQVQKSYYPKKWPCCAGTLVQDVADYLIGIYFRSQDGIFVNLFVPSEVQGTWDSGPLRLIQHTRYPQDGEIGLQVMVPTPTEFTLHVRIPGWTETSATSCS